MPPPQLSYEMCLEAINLFHEHGNHTAAAIALGIPRSTFVSRCNSAKRFPDLLGKKERGFTLPPLPDEEMTAEELIAWRMRTFGKKKEAREARRLIQVKVALDGPIGILHMGDPHVDDDGCDWPTLQRHVDLAKKTDGLFAGNIGDLSNNWVGRLARLFAQQSTSAKQAWKLVEWLVGELRWLYLLGGNHDVWSGDGDPIKWMAAQCGTDYTAHGTRLGLNFPNGRQCRVNARHDFTGSSQWNTAHGPLKAAMLGHSDHIYVAGHLHTFGCGWHKQPDGTWSCVLRLGTYKTYDGYADQKGYRDQNLPACVTLIFPDSTTEEGFVELFKDVERAADYLAYARRRHASGKTVKKSTSR